MFLSQEARLRRACRQAKTFLGLPLHKLKIFRYQRTGESSAIVCCDKKECREDDACKPV